MIEGQSGPMTMRCSQCGSEISESTAVCGVCNGAGQDAESSNPTALGTPAVIVPSETPDSTNVPFVPMFATGSDVKGIGGWLIPTIIGLTLGPFFELRGIYRDLHVLDGAQFQAGLAARPGIAVLILFEAMTNAIFFMALIGLNILLYRTRRAFPGWMITYLVAALLITLCDHIWTMHFHPSTPWTAVFQRLAAAVVWVPYFLQSRRVEQTFVN
jgi:hypothetical protein